MSAATSNGEIDETILIKLTESFSDANLYDGNNFEHFITVFNNLMHY